MAAYTSAATGNWADSATWGGGGVPGDGDTATIANTHTVTIPTSTSVTVGTSGATGTTALTVQSGGNLYIVGTINLRGNLVQQRNTTVDLQPGSSLVYDPPTGSQYCWHVSKGGSGAGTYATAKGTGTGWGAGQFASVSTSARGGSNGYIDGHDSASNLYSKINFAYTKFNTVGTTAGSAIRQYIFTTGQEFILSNCLFISCSQLYVSNVGADTNINYTNVDVRAPTGATDILWIIGSTTVTTGSRTISNFTVYDDSGSLRLINLMASDISTNHLYTYNASIMSNVNSLRMTNANGIWVRDVVHSNSMLNMQRETTSSVTGTVYYNRYNNPHPNYEGWAATSLGTSNTYSNCIFDGDNYHSSDAGDSITAQGEATISNCIGINKSGPLVVGNGSTGKHTVSHCTVVMPFPEQPAYGELINVGETTGSATHLTAVKDCIIMDAPRGIAQRSAFISQTGFALDYNVSYNITGTSLFTYPVGHPYAGQTSYLGPEDFNPWWSPSKTFGTDNATHDMVVDPKLRNKNWTVRGYFGAASIQDVAREVVSINGIDYQGNTTTPTTKSAETIWASAVWAFSPTNGLLRKAGGDGITIGAAEWSNPRRK